MSEEYTYCPIHTLDVCCPWVGTEDGCGECSCCREETAIIDGEAMPLADAVWTWLGSRSAARATMSDILGRFSTISGFALELAVSTLVSRGGAIRDDEWVHRVE